MTPKITIEDLFKSLSSEKHFMVLNPDNYPSGYEEETKRREI